MASDPKPVIGTAPCDHVGCTETVTVHEVKRGGSAHRGQLYTRCPGCGCDQTSGKRRQQWLIDNTTPRPDYVDLFEFKKKSGDNTVSDDTGFSDVHHPDYEAMDKVTENAVSETKSPAVALGILGLMVAGGLALIGFKK